MANYFIEDEVSTKAVDWPLLKRLLIYIRPYKKLIIFGVLFSLSASFLGPLRPYISQVAIDDYVAVGDLDGLHLIGLLLLLILILEIAFQYGLTYVTSWLGQLSIYDLRMDIYKFIQRLNLTFFDRSPIGRLISRVTSDVEVLNELFKSGIVAVFGDLLRLTFIMIIMFYTDWQLSLITLSVLPFMIYGSFVFRKKARESYLEVRGQVAKLTSFLQEHIGGISLIQIFNTQKRAMFQFETINAGHRDAHIRGIFYYSVFFPAVDFLTSLALALIIWYGGGQVVQSTLTIGVLFMFIQYVEQFFRPIRDLSEKYDILQRAMASSDRIFKLLDRTAYLEKNNGTYNPGQIFGGITFKNVKFKYQEDDENWILNDVSFNVQPGQKVAIVGATGAGKTTIISLLNRFYNYQSGDILIDNKSLSEYDLYFIRSQIGVVLQDVFLFSGTIYENLTLGKETITEEQVERAAKMVQADQFIQKFEKKYHHRLHERGSNLSVGQRQLISFVRILLHNPSIIVLDEATSSVDTATEYLIQHAIEKVLDGRTALIIAHRLSTIHKSDKIIVMHKGQIKEMGTHKELMDKGDYYYRLYQLQYKDQELAAG